MTTAKIEQVAGDSAFITIGLSGLMSDQTDHVTSGTITLDTNAAKDLIAEMATRMGATPADTTEFLSRIK